jgi:hypothetical protein
VSIRSPAEAESAVELFRMAYDRATQARTARADAVQASVPPNGA